MPLRPWVVSVFQSVAISLNKMEFNPGDRIVVTLTTTPTGSDNDWDLYTGVKHPDGTRLYVTYEPALAFSPTPVPARPGKPVSAESVTVFDMAIPSGLPAGNWKWGAALAKPGLTTISPIAWAPFTLGGQ